MEVILLENIKFLGQAGATVNVKRGYARNYLVPYGKAIYATASNIARFAAMKDELMRQAQQNYEQALRRKEELEALGGITIAVKAGDSGKLFGSVGSGDICRALCDAGFSVVKHDIVMRDGAIRALGNYEITVVLHSDVHTSVTIDVVANSSNS